MGTLLKILRNKDQFAEKFALLLVILFGILASWDLIQPGYWNHHDDLQAMRVLQMEKCFLDGQIPCRWVPDMGYGYGYPLFNYYPPLPYYLGQVFRLVGFSFLDTVKALGVFAFTASGITMYFLGKELFGRKGGVLSAVFYIWAPYHAVDIFVRAAFNEAFSMIWFPLALLFSLKLIKEEINLDKWMLFLSLSWFALLTSHNLMVLIFAPFFVVWMFVFLIKYRKIKRLGRLFVSGLISLGLASFFFLPVFFEKDLVQIDTLVQGFFSYTAHFVSIDQLFFSRFWDDGPSVWGPEDEMAFPVGHVHWITAAVLAVFLFYLFYKKGLFKTIFSSDANLATTFFLALGLLSAFMTHNKSTFIWKAMEGQMKFIQFPWRFLTLNTLGFSAASGFLIVFLKWIKKKFVLLRIIFFAEWSFVISILLILVAWNFVFFRIDSFGPVTDESKFSGVAWELQQTAGIYDYLPNTSKMAPQSQREELAEFMQGEGEIVNVREGTNWAKFDLQVDSAPATIRVNTIYYPTWKAYVNSQETETFIPEDEMWGRFYFKVEQEGYYNVETKLHDTPVRTAGNYISLVTWAGVVFYTYRKKLFLGPRDEK